MTCSHKIYVVFKYVYLLTFDGWKLSEFLFLGFERGWRPSYRNVLLDVRKKLGIPCSSKLPTGDLEAEIFLHLLQEYSGYFCFSFLS